MQQDVDKRLVADRQVMAGGRRRTSWPTILTAVIMLTLIGGLAAFQLVFKPAMIKSFLAKAVPPPATISTDIARAENWVPKLPSVGSLISIQGIDVTTQVAANVSAVLFDSGQEVAAGTKLITLESSIEQADLLNNQALLRQTELDLARQNDLSLRSIASQATQQAAQAKRDSAAATVQRTAAVIAQKTIFAPFAGKLGIRKVELGQYVSPGMSIATLQALNPIRVDFPMPEQDVSKLKVGQTVELTVDAFPKQIFKGQIASLDARVNLDTRTLLVRAQLPNPEKKLLPGMFANLSVLSGDGAGVVTVPRTAITYSLFGDSVFVVKPAPENNAAEAAPNSATAATPAPAAPTFIAERRFVRVGEAREDRASIVEGLATGDQVVISGQLKLQNGARVKVDNSVVMQPPAERPKL